MPGSLRRWSGAWRILQRPSRSARRATEVDALLVKTKLVEQMQGFDQWEDWKRRDGAASRRTEGGVT